MDSEVELGMEVEVEVVVEVVAVVAGAVATVRMATMAAMVVVWEAAGQQLR